MARMAFWRSIAPDASGRCHAYRYRHLAMATALVSALCSCPAPAALPLDDGGPDAAVMDAPGLDASARDTPGLDGPSGCADPDRDGDGADAMACGGTDCDDADPARAPGNAEVCDPVSVDEDCDASTFGDRDVDGDGHHDDACCNGTVCGDDCDDTRPDVYLGLVEACDMRDNDCDAAVDEGVTALLYPDADLDLYGAPGGEMVCADAAGYVSNPNDCDDSNPSVHPLAPEECNGIDDDCDAQLDGPNEDDDLDGHADASGCSCTPRSLCDDCDDRDPTIYGGAPELCNDVDDACDGRATEDADGDGYAAVGVCSGGPLLSGDCDDANRLAHPGAVEVCENLALGAAVDTDCDGTFDEGVGTVTCYPDADGDAHGAAGGTPMVVACPCPSGYGQTNTDCCDSDADVFAGQTAYFSSARACGGYDYDCDGAELSVSNVVSPGVCACTAGRCTGTGWRTSVPACGATGTLRTCGPGFLCGGGCTDSGGFMTRRCR